VDMAWEQAIAVLLQEAATFPTSEDLASLLSLFSGCL
jgi:hypothetical protein